MIKHPRTFLEQLSPDDIETVRQSALHVLAQIGLYIQSQEACRRLADAGARVDEDSQRCRMPADFVEKYLSMAPAEWILHARNPEKNIHIGGRELCIAPGYGSAFVADSNGRRREATLADLERFALLAGRSKMIDITGGVIVEPMDVPPALRPLEITRALLVWSDKPILGSVAGAAGARVSIEMAEIVFGDLKDKCAVLGLININSPLRLDARMAEAMLEYVKAGQPVLLTPGILMGVTAPVTAIGALVQAFAEIIGSVVLAQVLRPGVPVIVGTGGFGSDLRTAGSGFGRPENALGTLLGAQMARRLRLPFRCSAAVTGARLPDCRSGYERMMTAFTAWSTGAHVCLQGAGVLDCINSMSYELFVIDTEIWGYIKRIADSATVNQDTLALHVINATSSDYLAHEHTVRHMRREIYTPSLVSPDTYESWLASGGRDVVSHASAKLNEILRDPEPPFMAPDTRKELDKYVTAHRAVK